jgi:hypothetical protein
VPIPYRVVVWGPGQMGSAAIRELLRRQEFEIVGVLAFSESKNGVDVGELVGLPAIGVKVTTDKDAILALDADVVVFTGIFTTTLEMAETQNQDVIRILESGKHVVTPCAFTYPAAHGEAYVQRLEDACRKGNVCLHGSGENPGFWFERVAVTLTGVVNDVEYITLDEYADCGGLTTVETVRGIGFGVPPETAKLTGDALEVLWTHYHFNETLNFVSKTLFGRHLDSIEVEPVYHVAEEDIVFEKAKGDPLDFTIESGQVKAMTYRIKGILDGEVRLVDSVNWYYTERTSPFEGKEDSTWDIEIEGKPTSLKCSVQARASVKNDQQFYPGDPTTPTWYVTIAAVIQSIPVVCSRSAPGIVSPTFFTHAVPDLRMLEAGGV